MDQFQAFVALGGTLPLGIITRAPTTLVPTNPDADPVYTVYEHDGSSSTIATGTLTKRHTGNISGAAVSGATYELTTSANHNLKTGQLVTLAGITGTGALVTDCAGLKLVTVTAATKFTISGTYTPGGTYGAGGTFNVAGFYSANLTLTGGQFARGKHYACVVNYQVGGVNMQEVVYFAVV